MDTKNIQVIGLMGKAGSGKTHIARTLCETLRETHPDTPVQQIAFATPIKKMIAMLFDTEEKTMPVYKDKTLRYLYQTLGTEWGRNLVDENLWIDLTLMRTYDGMEKGYIIVEDVRFLNELRAIEKLKGKVFFLTMEGLKNIKESQHVSETEMREIQSHAILTKNIWGKEKLVAQTILQRL